MRAFRIASVTLPSTKIADLSSTRSSRGPASANNMPRTSQTMNGVCQVNASFMHAAAASASRRHRGAATASGWYLKRATTEYRLAAASSSSPRTIQVAAAASPRPVFGRSARRKYSTFCFADSFDSPASRSRNVIGTSTTREQSQRTMISRPILNPTGRGVPRARAFFVVQKKPDIGSVDFVSGNASAVAPAEMARRTADHSKPTPPAPTLRLPTLKSARPSSTGAATAGTASGSCCRSASMQSTTPCSAAPKPKSTADERPRPSLRFRVARRTT
mmetsp:Transcript_20489/g.64469  ORF Transcript_20489/g.64469 Transcript_20489/m.64469 type:complete len:275 (-) Transcript_20489:894-1718(-)